MRTARSAFMVQIDDDPTRVDQPIRGRVEHVLSGAAVEFESADGLVGFIAEALDTTQRTAPQPARGSKHP